MIALLGLRPGPAGADVVARPPAHPIAAATLFGEFAVQLDPVDWIGIADRYKAGHGTYRDQGPRSVYELLAPVSGFAGEDVAGAIRAAIRAGDVARFRAAALGAASFAVRYHLERARRFLDRPRGALPATRQAQAIYAALALHVRARDPVAYRRVGLAWLDLTTIASRSGARRAFEKYAARIEAYLVAEFEKQTPPPLGRDKLGLPPDAHIASQDRLPRAILNFEKRGIDERKLFLVAYGDMLFDSPEIYGATARRMGITCSGCHNRGDANPQFFIPGISRRPGGLDVDSALFHAAGNDGKFDPVDIPGLRGIRFTAPYGRDGRTAELRKFTRDVIVTEFGGPEPTKLMLDALVAYQEEFDFLPNAAITKAGALAAEADAAARRGEALFHRKFPSMGGRACADCHRPGNHFLDGKRHDIGTGGGFDTPTLLGSVFTPPYFHDGSRATLADVVAWFDRRYRLGLALRDRHDLTAYLKAVGGGEEPYQRFDARNTPFRLAAEELSVFLSTLDRLLRDRDAFHAELLLKTVARDLRADSGSMSNIARAPWALELAARLDAMRAAVASADWASAEAQWRRYKAAEKSYVSELY